MKRAIRGVAFSFVASVTGLVLTGCAGAGNVAPARASGGESSAPISVPAVSDDGFSSAVRELLLTTPNKPERLTRLAAVEGRQMDRAVAHFHRKAPKPGLRAVTGALLLLRDGELRPGLLGEHGVDAVRAAVREVATRGDEGRSLALYNLLQRLGTAADKDEAGGHLEALRTWVASAVASGGPIQSAGAVEQVAVLRSLLEPSEAARRDAVKVTNEWVKRALELQTQAREHRVGPGISREEVGEADRALSTGANVLVDLYLVRGDAAGALNVLNASAAADLARKDLVTALNDVNRAPSAAHWIDLMREARMASEAQGEQGEEGPEDLDLVRAATFGAAIEAYRLDPTEPEAAGVVAASLAELGMGEASPTVLTEAAKAHPDSRVLALSLSLVVRVLEAATDADDADSARRTFKAAGPLLATADAAKVEIVPDAPHVRALMGEIELREGRLAPARTLLTQAVSAEKSGAILLPLAHLDEHEGKSGDVARDIEQALAARDTKEDAALRGSVLLYQSDVAREHGDLKAARGPLTEALRVLLKARTSPDDGDRARSDRVLVKVLDRFGATAAADRTVERALDAAGKNKDEASATIALAMGRSLVRGDLAAGRRSFQRALAADLDQDDLVYYALCMRLLEKQLKAAPDPSIERVFSSAIDDGRWTGKLAQYGAGLLDDSALLKGAQTPAQHTEALFYTAMARRARGDARGAMTGLADVVKSDGIDLMEVGIARELLDGPKAQLPGPVPPEAAAP